MGNKGSNGAVRLWKRFADVLMALTRNKRGIVGIGILVFFALLALGAPLFTPYSPVYSQEVIAADVAYPVWFKYLPGYQKTGENLNPITDPTFTNEETLQQIAFTSSPQTSSLTLQHNSNVGSPSSGSGCLSINFQRDPTETAEVKATLTREFYYPYEGPPKRFNGQIYAKVEEVTNATQWSVEIRALIQTPDGETKYLWSARQGGAYKSGEWITPSIYGYDVYPPLIDSYSLDPQQTTFSKQGNYKYGVEITFNKDIEKASVYIDDLDLKLFGYRFGPLGTNNTGLDIYTQLVYGTRISLLVGITASLLSVVIGLSIGLFAAYFGRFVDQILMRLTDMFLVIPELPLLLVIVAVLGPSIWNIILIIGFLGWMGFARTIRSQALSLKERPFVEAAKAVGAGRLHIISRHILPNVMNLVYVTLAMSVPGAIMSEAYLSFLGLYDPYTMTWGRMLNEALLIPGGVNRWWWVIPPGLCIAAISMSFILIGYALDEILNPKVRERR